jgi:long-chain acyl-CoA synthetase
MPTLPEFFARTVADHPDQVALRWKSAADAFGEWTWRDYAERVGRLAAALRDLGVGHGTRVVLMMRNRPEFHIADTAVLLLGATPISIYNSSAPEQVQYLVGHCEASVAIVEDIGFLERFLKVRSELPALRHIAIVDDPELLAADDIHRWDVLLGAAPLTIDGELGNARADDLLTVIYTSGTTGPPKGVMLDHENMDWTMLSFRQALGIDPTGFRVVSYLPMAHVAERTVSHYMAIAAAYEVTTCPDPGQIVSYLVQRRPQFFFAVPRVWEKAHAALRAAIAADPEQAAQFEQALEIGWEMSEANARDEAVPEAFEDLWALVGPALQNVRAQIGLDQCEIAMTGAAPIPFEILKFFRSLGVPLSEVYGLSETSGPMTWTPFHVKVGTVGPALPGVEVTLDEDGEVLTRGGNVFRGYLNAPEQTADVFDAEGWFHTGDIGVLDADGYLKIVDRKKELIITAGGKNISPANLESALKAGTLIGQACVIGDNQPYVSALLVLDAEVAPAWARAHDIDATDPAAIAAHPDVLAEVGREVDEANARFSNVERIKRWTLLADEWQPDSEELTPTMKLKRRGVHRKYADEIAALYD